MMMPEAFEWLLEFKPKDTKPYEITDRIAIGAGKSMSVIL